jgi:hypothetical protein
VDELRSASGEPAIAVPAAGDTTVLVNGVSHAVRVAEPMPAGTAPPSVASIAFVTPAVEPKERWSWWAASDLCAAILS